MVRHNSGKPKPGKDMQHNVSLKKRKIEPLREIVEIIFHLLMISLPGSSEWMAVTGLEFMHRFKLFWDLLTGTDEMQVLLENKCAPSVGGNYDCLLHTSRIFPCLLSHNDACIYHQLSNEVFPSTSMNLLGSR